MKLKLERCPFCGSVPVWDTVRALGGSFHVVRCSGAMLVSEPTRDMMVCEIQPRTPGFFTKREAAACWNRRAFPEVGKG